MVGFGTIGRGLLPLLWRHVQMEPKQLTILCAECDATGHSLARRHGVELRVQALTETNHQLILESHLQKGDLLLNMSSCVDCQQLVRFCQTHHILYLDTAIEEWNTNEEVWHDMSEFFQRPTYDRTMHCWVRHMLAMRREFPSTGSTALLSQGCNPGLVQQFAKQALLNIARETLPTPPSPLTQPHWARLAKDLGIKILLVVENDTQTVARRKGGKEWVNTWSIPSFCYEWIQPAELGWGSHERHFPSGGQLHCDGTRNSLYFHRPGGLTQVRTWSPCAGEFLASVIAHEEVEMLTNYYTSTEDGEVYRPTVYFAYQPCPDGLQSFRETVARRYQHPNDLQIRLVSQEDGPVEGMDEVGVLLGGHDKHAYWYGSRLTAKDANERAPGCQATTLQVVAGALGGLVWVLENPNKGIVTPDEVDFARVLEIAEPYIAPVVGQYNSTLDTRLNNGGLVYPESPPPTDAADVWQFINFKVDY
eukprot:NODE_1364_length_1536_cov_24.237757_g1291_i0.p1 GENE.NODE_1364_length_1536_cov_24.237757_g1291_i0~~NODE_1364_length_1536_cov_24.237757_g1291_i0.p1  ORF type:complete len:502 (-),score=92.09 NODE_1364_length_1536_cov_24.237757_g1291_i0:30-1460(-)